MPSLFRSRGFLIDHAQRILRFYHPRAIDPDGGCFHYFRDDGTVYDRTSRHLVSSTRFVFVYATAARHLGRADLLAPARHALAFLESAHRDPIHGGYAWTVEAVRGGARRVDGTNHAYGLAFVLLAQAEALRAGIGEARSQLDATAALLDRRFWSEADGLYADEASADWCVLSSYRGQNANMHACEAHLAAWEATGQRFHLERAARIADNIVRRQAGLAGGLVWEHHRENWSVDWDYNRHDPANLFRPWGYQPGHLTEWAKLLCILHGHRGALAGDHAWLVARASTLFEVALERAWDAQWGGIAYGFAPDGTICDRDKYHWVQAESIAAAAMLGAITGEARWWDWYDRLWAYVWHRFVDHHHGAWFRILTPDGRRYSDEKSPAGKTDYHNLGACWQVLAALDLEDARGPA